ncbi:MAG TPA: hypothetical protein VJU83_11365 [Burkholderiales bacterium]|nr:hypothetical protein [Burkholderiales bacterium]
MEDTATADSTSGWPPLAEWPTFTEAFLEGDRLEQYLQRKRGVHLYYEGAADNRIRESAGVSRHQIYRLITERCLVQAPDGRICGWRGLIPFQRQRKWVRTKPLTPTVNGKGLSGALSLLLGLHPELKIAFDKRIVRGQRTESLGRKNNQPQDHWTWFLKQCRKLGLEARREWPFNTERRGYIAICRYVKRVLDANPDKAAAAVGGPQLKKQMSSGDGVDRPAFDIFERVEMDGHHLDGRFCVMVPSHTGIWEPRLVHRLWVIVILEIVSRAVLGYYFSLNFELKKEDVLSAIQNALSRWTPRPISFGDHAYKPNAGFPSMLGDDFVGACWDETSVDGALAQKCPTVEKVLNQVVGARIVSPYNSFAVRRSMNDRPFIETFFRTLSERSLHKISNTTGGRPAQRKGTKPEEIAVTSQSQIE